MSETDIGVLLHPGGGGFQYPFRFRPHRPRNIWRRTPGPRPPGGPTSSARRIVMFVGLLAIVLIIAGALTDWFGLSGSDEPTRITAQSVEDAGFVIERNVVDGKVRVLNGEFRGVDASILIPMDGQVITSGIPEAQRAAQWQQLGGEWEALRAGETLVLCEPVPECSDLVVALAEVAFGD